MTNQRCPFELDEIMFLKSFDNLLQIVLEQPFKIAVGNVASRNQKKFGKF